MKSERVVISIGLFPVLVASCATLGFTSSETDLVKQASFDHDCPVENIEVKKSMESGTGSASFVLDVCGTERKYRRFGTTYMQVGSEPPEVEQAKGE